MNGGEQEGGKRGGTENVPGIVGFAKAVEIAGSEMNDVDRKLLVMRDRLIKEILSKIDHSRLNGHPSMRLSNNVNVSLESVEGESMLLNLDLEGIAASTGSACSSGSLEPSHVLLSLGLSHEVAHSSLRFTLGRWTTDAEVDKVLEVLPGIVKKLRAMSPLYKGG